MKLWEYIKEKMLVHPTSTVNEGELSITYAELCELAENKASDLADSYYCILCGSEISTAVAILSCLAAGKVAIPLPTRYGSEICSKVLSVAEPPGIITDLEGELSYIETGIVAEAISPDAAVMLFTSGSTGIPKGVVLSNKNVISNLEGIASYFKIDKNDTFLISRPLYHSSVLTGEFLYSLCCGANIVFYSGSFHPSAMIRICRERSVTALGSTPTLMSLFSDFIRPGGSLPLRVLSVSGECMTSGMARRIRRAFPNADVYCGYGLSEASPRVAYLPPECFDEDPTCAGIPLPNVKIKIAKKEKDIGELLVCGDNVMMGYFRDPIRTIEAKRDGWLRTGDLAMIDSRGMLYIKGRADDMIIRAGMNVYPAEIENALSSDERTDEVQVYGFSDGSTQQIGLRICGSFANREEVSALCREKLPSYQMPAKIEILQELPRGTSGKRKRATTTDGNI